MNKIFIYMIIAVGLSGCFNDSDSISSNLNDGSPASNFELVTGTYVNYRSNDDGGTVILIDDNQRLWEISLDEGNNFQGFGSSDNAVITDDSNGKFTASGKNYPFGSSSFNTLIKGDYTQSNIITGSKSRADTPEEIVVYSATYNEDFANIDLTLDNLSNNYSGSLYVTDDYNAAETFINVDNNGSFTGKVTENLGGSYTFYNCDVSGQFTLSESKTYLNVTMFLENVPFSNTCSSAGKSFEGIALLSEDGDEIAIAATNDNRSQGVFFFDKDDNPD